MEPEVKRLPRLVWRTLRRSPRELWKAVRHGDQSLLLSVLMELADEAGHPDAYYLDGRPLAPKMLIITSAAGLRAVAAEPALDKAPTAAIAVAISGRADAYEAVMGPAESPKYDLQISAVDALIRGRQRGLRRLVEARASTLLAAPCDFSLQVAQHFAASVILQDLFPAHAWTSSAIAEFVDGMEENAIILGPASQNAALRGQGVETLLRSRPLQRVAARYEALLSSLADEERSRRAEVAASASGRERDEQLEALRGLVTTLDEVGVPWADAKALITTTFAASYETVATSLTELIYQLACHSDLWEALRTGDATLRKRRITHALYEAVRIINPLPFLMRQADRPCTLRIEDGGANRSIQVEADQLVLGLLTRPLLDPHMFPDPLRLRLDLDAAQIDVIRLAFGIRAAASPAPDRFCKGFAYAIALLGATLEHLLERGHRPEMVVDAPIQMFGTRSRRRFRARLP